MKLTKKEWHFLMSLPDEAKDMYRSSQGNLLIGLNTYNIYPVPEYMNNWFQCIEKMCHVLIGDLLEMEVEEEG